ncbi:MAG: PKD domain-containing protein [Phaeodactylibacter sp.]|nr:PKD domain-containing protein [Phaeodactylibacter sp.]
MCTCTLALLPNGQAQDDYQITGPQLLCFGDCGTYSISPMDSLFVEFFWYYPQDPNTILSNEPTITICPPGPGQYQLNLLAYSINGTTFADSIFIQVNQDFFYAEVFSDAAAVCPAANSPGQDSISQACDVVCSNSRVTYSIEYFAGGIPTTNFDFTVTGGQIISQNFDQLTVEWGTPGAGTVTFVFFYNFCGDPLTITKCVEILDDPIAGFTTTPAAVNDTVFVCQGQEVLFQNTSQYAETFSWNFGNGTTSTNTNGAAIYNNPGTFTVELTAYNACLCSDATTLTVVVEAGESPLVDCVGTICENTLGTYTAQASCGTYLWTVSSNGTVVDGGGPNDDFVSVDWGAGPEGLIELTVENCPGLNTCLQPSFIRVPILSEDAAIDGPANVCRGDIAAYSITPYGGTSFDWSVSNFGTILSGQGTNEIVVEWFDGFLPNEQQWVAVSFDNCYLGCGGADTLEVDINPAFTVSGPIENCQGQSSAYSTRSIPGNAAVSCNWTVVAPDGSVAWTSAAPTATPTVDWSFPAGAYRLIAEPENPGDYCTPQHITIVAVTAPPPPVDAILGDSLICPGQVYTYEAQSPLANARFRWEVNDGGTVTVREGRKINVSFGATPPFELTVVQIDGLDCESEPFAQILSTIPALTLSGPTDACDEGLSTFSTDAYTGLEYTWAISPAGAGTITGEQDEATVEILWHHVGPVTVTVQSCGQSADINVQVHALPEPAVQHPTALCPNETTQVQTTAAFSTYEWLDKDGNLLSSNPDPFLGPGTYRLLATDANGCTGDTTFRIMPYPESDISISTPDPNVFCNVAPLTRLFALNTDAGYNYQWYQDGNPVGTDAPQYTATATGVYYVEITDVNGCTFRSNSIAVIEDCSGGGGPGGGCPFLVNLDFDILPTPACDIHDYQNTSSGYIPGTTSWFFDDPASGANNISNLDNPSHDFSGPGYYRILMAAEFDDPGNPGSTAICGILKVDSVVLAANFSSDTACAGVAVPFADLSTFLPSTSITAWAWDFGDPASGAANTANTANPTHTFGAPGMYAVTLEVTSPEGCTASITKEIEVFGPPAVSFEEPGISCEATALPFAADAGPEVVHVEWDFGDPASGEANSSELMAPYHRYDSPGTYTVTLNARSIYGCENSFSRDITVEPNALGGNITASVPSPLCEGDTTVLSAPAGGIAWLWSTGDTTASIEVFETGIYSLTVTDDLGCAYEPAPMDIEVLPAPGATIRGVEYDEFGQPIGYAYDGYQACFGTDIFLEVIANPQYSYTWNNGTTGTQIEFSEDRNNLLPVGTHEIFVAVTNNTTGCPDTVGPFVVEVHPLPAQVQITASPAGPNCESTPVTFSVTNPDPGVTYRWNNGLEGPAMTTSQAGEYFATAVNAFGCEAESNRLEITAGPNISLIPSGCYSRCRPDTLCLPEIPGIVSYQWYFNGSPLGPQQAGLPELIADQSGEYYVEMTNSDGCTLNSGPLVLEMFDGVGTILGEVYVDVNDNGIIDAADTTYSGAVLELLQNGTLVGSTASGPDGAYAFPNIAADAYTVRLDTNSTSPLGLLVNSVDTSFTGCGTTVTINWLLEDCPMIMSEVTLSGCGSINYAGTPFTSDTSFVATYTTSSGCDSLEEVNIIILQPTDSSLELSACMGSTVEYNGVQLNPNQVRAFNFTNAVGCDSTVIVTVLELLPTSSMVELSACTGTTVPYDTVQLSPGQVRNFTFTNAAGCDSTVTVTVAELLPTGSTVELGACPGSTVMYDTTALNPGQVQDFIFTNAAGCDSTVTVTVAVLQPTSSSLELSACPGSTVDYNGTPLSPEQQQDFIFTNAAGCDSTVTVTVTALPTDETLIQLAACPGDSAHFGNTSILAGTSQDFSFANQHGCDSLVRVEVEELPAYRQDVELSTCQDSVFFAGMMLPVGSTELVLTTQSGCDSVLAVQVTRYPEEQTELVLETCPDGTVDYQGEALAPGDERTVTLISQFGCDSVVHVQVQAYLEPGLEAVVEEDCPDASIGAIIGSITQETLPPYRFSLDGNSYSDNPLFDGLESGAYDLFVQDGRGCTASVPVQVDESAPLIFEVLQDSLSCDKQTATLTLAILSGDDGALEILWGDGSTALSRQVDSAGLYSLRVRNSCQIIEQQILVPAPALRADQMLYVPNAFSPNEDGRNDAFLPAAASDAEFLEYDFRVFNRWGAELFSTDNFSAGWDGTVQGDRQSTGVYVWYVKGRMRVCGQEVDVYKEGDVVLMR